MLPGRSRGRAKTVTSSEAQVPPAASSSITRLPAPSQQTARLSSPSRGSIQAAEPGRGRGIATSDIQTTVTSMTATTTTTSSGSGSGGTTNIAAGEISPSGNGSGSSESPPEQHSPPAAQPAGRAALRGTPHTLGPGTRSDILAPMERMALQETGDVQPQVVREERTRIETVLYTRPPHFTEKRGAAGEKLKLFCNFFEIVQHPNWMLYQYHVDFEPLIESKKMRIALMRPHESLFNNKAFDGSTLFSLTKLPNDVSQILLYNLDWIR